MSWQFTLTPLFDFVLELSIDAPTNACGKP
jgi:hypothetical protein